MTSASASAALDELRIAMFCAARMTDDNGYHRFFTGIRTVSLCGRSHDNCLITAVYPQKLKTTGQWMGNNR
jgi:hypothetical protein